MDCNVSVHYKDSDFELDQCDAHRKKRHSSSEHEKELEYKLTYTVLDSDDRNLSPSIDSEDTKMIPPDEDSSEIPKLSLVILLSFFFFV